MLPVLHKPILEYIVEEMKNFGVEIIYIIVGHKKRIIQNYFKNGEGYGVKIKYIEQKKPKGIAHAISLTEDFIKEPFIVILGDDFTIARSLQKVIDFFWNKQAFAVTGVVEEKNITVLQQTNCVFLDKDNRVKEIIEKPANPKSNIRGCGIYVFNPAVFKYIKKTPVSNIRNEIEISDTLKLMAKEGKVYAAYIEGVNININSFFDFLQANKFILDNLNSFLKNNFWNK